MIWWRTRRAWPLWCSCYSTAAILGWETRQQQVWIPIRSLLPRRTTIRRLLLSSLFPSTRSQLFQRHRREEASQKTRMVKPPCTKRRIKGRLGWGAFASPYRVPTPWIASKRDTRWAISQKACAQDRDFLFQVNLDRHASSLLVKFFIYQIKISYHSNLE